ncbi:putative polyketide synthase protein [Microtetraspora sp. NBRC 13810]|uniref:class I SAM-dependent methyltransferase n=1 Tax=Microtetraspora sp. NBRC 13810 TaxID=3030990 RepID=UPI0024A2F662|nr:class I SAM-dependent methyltransferase [Microtetraspora sp. NBRC 13810]GLW11945.1 putative polyketide synthase protein [Microtetraspora sp. NBRC 13810]
MTAEKVHLTGEKATLLATLYGRALDSLAKQPILGDPFAIHAARRLDYDLRRTRVSPTHAAVIALRAKQLDLWTAEFVAAHPEAVVLHLACGLDSRVHRLDPPPTVEWYDVDYPEVIELRERIYPGRDAYRMIAASVTDPGWLREVRGNRPALVVAEGLTMYLREQDGLDLFRRLTGHFPEGELAFDAYTRLGVRLQRFNAAVRAAGATLYWGFDDPAALERAVPGVRLVAEVGLLDVPGFDRLSRGDRVTFRLLSSVLPLRRLARLLRYRF